MNTLTALRRHAPRLMLMLAMLAAMSATLGACGRIGNPHQPSKEFYNTYPDKNR
ncbi:hypothetical protein LV564_09215 [Komagataeibacter nataicola]|uniref:hypothetical protein n=1 Tax=Komagataeibacter nataicola TaxID=265960 RepID=UPI001428CDC3|nr:hypothetical protein [Komagataeibacter nataicola]WEQ57189.1 hypothetical protein LV564_09215 [Komagataeibacter nataicola]WNM08778.1 hypothetical protein RI056_01150 [Komagataeibacter nataicola]GBR17102.1 hypothetical protein AA0616_0963 [Komagataeibacter nataicola NRIC 0616]